MFYDHLSVHSLLARCGHELGPVDGVPFKASSLKVRTDAGSSVCGPKWLSTKLYADFDMTSHVGFVAEVFVIFTQKTNHNKLQI